MIYYVCFPFLFSWLWTPPTPTSKLKMPPTERSTLLMGTAFKRTWFWWRWSPSARKSGTSTLVPSVAIQTSWQLFRVITWLSQTFYQKKRSLPNFPPLRNTESSTPGPNPIRPCFRRHPSGRWNNGSPDFGPRHVPTRGPGRFDW